jgi:hypothetical protein
MDVTIAGWQPAPVPSLQRLAAPAALATTVVLWASAFAAIREAVPALGWEHLSLLRLAAAALVLAAIAAWRRVGLPARRDLPLLALCALSGMTAYQVLLNAGELTVPAATASLLVNVSPIFTALMAVAPPSSPSRPAAARASRRARCSSSAPPSRRRRSSSPRRRCCAAAAASP